MQRKQKRASAGTYVIFVHLGNPTRLAPIPKPAPDRAETARLGTYTSKIANVAAADSAIKPTSSNFRRCLGIE